MEKKNRGKRIFCFFVALVMLLSMLPAQVYAAHYEYDSSKRPTTITVSSTSGTRIEGAQITVTRSSNTYEVIEEGSGVYKFSRYSSNRSYTFTVTVSAQGYETTTVTMRGNRSSLSVTLAEKTVEFADFNVFYTADGHIPDNGYSAANDAVDYGPSADNTPLTTIRVNVTALRELAEQEDSPVVYNEGDLSSGNQYEFIPQGSHTDADYLEKIEAFWAAVITCVDEQSILAFEETGLYGEFVLYCLKKQGDGSTHADGILNVTPPVYVVELYQNEVYFGGGVTDSAENSVFLTAYDILDQYESHLKQTITWVEDESGKPMVSESGQYTGTYIDPATNKIHNIAVFQTGADGAETVEGSEIPYVRQTDTYYLAQFNMSVDEGTEISYLITYTDGVENDEVFSEHEYAAQKNDTVPAFTGAAVREDYTFLGWYLEGGDGSTVYTAEDISAMSVESDMVFHAVWAPIIRYTGTVKVIINGSWDATAQTLLSGTPADIETPLKLEAGTQMYLSCDEAEFIALGHTETGVYSATLENGVYYAYYYKDDGFVKISDQPLIIENTDRTRYLFYNTVYHDLNGGTLDGSSENVFEYFHSGDRVTVCDKDPVREGYIFDGWLTNDGVIHRSGEILTESIDRAYTVTAQWIRATDIYVHIKIDHYAKDGIGYNTDSAKHNIAFTVDTRSDAQSDFTEIYRKTVLWDGESVYDGTDYEYSYISQNGVDYTRYVAAEPNLTAVSAEQEYTVTTNKSGYVITDITQQTDENGDLHIYATAVYDPTEFDFVYSVVLDDEAKALPSQLWPKAVNVKVTCFFDGDFVTITQQKDIYERVEIGADGEGTGSYPVWMYSTEEVPQPYYYRIEVVSYEMGDGSIVAAEDIGSAHTDYDAVDKSYLSVIEVTGGTDPDSADDDLLTGVYYDGTTQVGSVRAVVSVPVYTVTLMTNGGALNGSSQSTLLEDLIVMPDISGYIPERAGGYVFDGWYYYEDGAMTDVQAVSGSALTEDVTLIAKWKDPISVEGIVTVAATYEQTNGDGTVTLQYIHEVDRVQSVRVLLQKKNAGGYYETVDWLDVLADYTKEDYYFQKTEDLLVPVGVADYSFTGVADDGSEYRIYVLSANYSETFQNEPQSVSTPLQYDSYTADGYDALGGDTEPQTATVNAHLHFTPPAFDLNYRVDATAIGEGYRPEKAEVLVTYDSDPAVYEPWKWTVISQMVFGDTVKGNTESLTDGIAEGSDSVWKYSYDGSTLYDYGISIGSTQMGEAITPYTDNPYFYIEYQAPAHFDTQTGGQSQLLVAKLLPRTYSITYQTNGGTVTGTHTNTHTWSYQTVLSEVVPVREGYHFVGWYEDEALTVPLTDTVIAADRTGDITYYAKWQQVMDSIDLEITVDNSTADGGVTDSFDGLLTVTLARRLRGSSDDFIQITGQQRSYDSAVWNSSENIHTMTDSGVFTGLSSEYDYNLFAQLDGYYVDADLSSVQKVSAEDGSTRHIVSIYLRYDPELLNLGFTVEMAEGTDKSLYPLYAEVKVTCWCDTPLDGTEQTDWYIITQHASKVVDVTIDWEEGKGTGSYPVWQWEDSENAVPWYYRIEVVSLELADGSVISLDETVKESEYKGGGYTAAVYAENGCESPSADTELYGAYGVAASAEETGAVYNYTQTGTLRAVISAPSVVFHANNQDADCYDPLTETDVFRTYYPASAQLPQGEYYSLSEDGTVPEFYDIPTFEYSAHNDYIFKGWYDAPDETGVPADRTAVYTEHTHLYAHWIEVDSVAKEEDGKQTGSDSYKSFDLAGAQIRDKDADGIAHHGTAGSGLRFITVLSESVYSQINALAGNESGAEYGFAVAKTGAAELFAQGGSEYSLQYNGTNVNGKDTSYDYRYVKNMKCSGVLDHYNGQNYRLYTAVITYKGLEGDALESAYATPFIARSYIRYYDANGLYRTHYNNYTGTQLYSSINTSFSDVRGIITGGEQ